MRASQARHDRASQCDPMPEDASPIRPQAIVLVTDAWHPQVNGVVQTWTYMQRELAALGHHLHIIHPGGSRGISAPGEPDVLLSLEPARHLARALGSMVPACLHIATEGPLGWAARAIARRRGWMFTTSFHTRFPEYLKARFGIPAKITLALLRRFHRDSRAVLVPNDDLRRELRRAGFLRTRLWSRGVDGELFRPGLRNRLALPRPVLLYVGRWRRKKTSKRFSSLKLSALA